MPYKIKKVPPEFSKEGTIIKFDKLLKEDFINEINKKRIFKWLTKHQNFRVEDIYKLAEKNNWKAQELKKLILLIT